MQIFYRLFIRKLNFYLEIWYHSWQAYTRQLLTLGSMPQCGARGQNLGHLIIFLESFVFEQQVLSLFDFRPEVL